MADVCISDVCGYWRRCCCQRADEPVGDPHCWGCSRPQSEHADGEHRSVPPPAANQPGSDEVLNKRSAQEISREMSILNYAAVLVQKQYDLDRDAKARTAWDLLNHMWVERYDERGGT